MTELSLIFEDRPCTWENDQRFYYSEMIRKLAEVEENTRTHISSTNEACESTLTGRIEEIATQISHQQQALQLVTSPIEKQKSILDSEFRRLDNLIEANEEMTSLRQMLNSSTRTLEEVTRHLLEHRKYPGSRSANNESPKFLRRRFSSSKGFLNSDRPEASSTASSSNAYRANEQMN